MIIPRSKSIPKTKPSRIVDIKKSFISLLIADLGLEGATKKIADFEVLSWQQFCTELGRSGVELTGAAKEDWFERFEQRKVETLALHARFRETDCVLDQLICDAFGFNEELAARIDQLIPEN